MEKYQCGESVNWRDEFERFIMYCERFFPGFRNIISGASKTDIERVEHLAGCPLSPEYRVFLEYMGRTNSNISGSFLKDTAYNINEIEQFHRETESGIPADSVYLWTLDSDAEYFISTNPDDDGFRPVILPNWYVDEEWNYITGKYSLAILYYTLFELLYYNAFIAFGRLDLKFSKQLWTAESDSSAFLNAEELFERRQQFLFITEKLNFRQIPFLTKNRIAFEREDASILVLNENNPKYYISTKNTRELKLISEILEDNLSLLVVG